MANKKITALTELAAQPAGTDMVPLVDISDTTGASTGTTKKVSVTNLLSSAPGETNTASNVGSGSGTEYGVFKQKTGVDLEFKKIKQGTNVTLTENASDITIAATDTDTTYTAGDGLDLSGTTFSTDLKSAGGLKITATELELDINGLTDLTNTTFGNENFGAGDHIALADASDSNNIKKVKFPVELGLAVSDESTDLATGTAKLTFRMPHAMTLTEVRANVNTAPVGATITVDINEGGTSILSTKLTIDASEKTSTTAAAAAVISDTALADDAEMTVDIDQVGSTTAGKGLKVWLIGYR